MDGGVDAAYVQYFGASIERKVREAIGQREEGYLPVGASVLISTGDLRIPWLIVAPTMEMPEFVEREHCYRAMRAILRVAQTGKDCVSDVYCPGLGTGVGGVRAEDAAEMMARAYRDWKQAVA